MAIQFVNSYLAPEMVDTAAQVVVTFPPQPAGSLLIAACATGLGASGMNVTAADNNAVPLTLIQRYNGTTGTLSSGAFYKISDGTETSITITGTITRRYAAIVLVYSGVDQVTPLDNFTENDAGASLSVELAYSSLAITPAVSAGAVVTFQCCKSTWGWDTTLSYTGTPTPTYRDRSPKGSANTVAGMAVTDTIFASPSETTTIFGREADNLGNSVVYAISITAAAAALGPVITDQPEGANVTEGDPVSFTTAATSSGGAMTSQWYKAPSTLMTGETGDTLSFTAALGDDNTGYFNRYTDDNGSTDTETAQLGVSQYTVNVEITLVNEQGSPLISMSNLKWAFFDEPTPDAFQTPIATADNGTTNGSGVFSVDITGSSLGTGEIGYLVVSNTDGTTTQSPPQQAFAGPVSVAAN